MFSFSSSARVENPQIKGNNRDFPVYDSFFEMYLLWLAQCLKACCENPLEDSHLVLYHQNTNEKKMEENLYYSSLISP